MININIIYNKPNIAMFSRGSLIILFISLLIGLAIAYNGIHNDKEFNTKKVVSIIQIIEHPALNATRDGVKNILNDKVIIKEESAQGDIGLTKQIIQKFLQQKVDVIVTLGTNITQIAVSNTKKTPIVFASVTDPIGSGIIKNIYTPEANITGISNSSNDNKITEVQLNFIKKIMPEIKIIGVIYNPSEPNSVKIIDDIKEVCAKIGLQLKIIPAQDTNEVVMAAKKGIIEVDAIFINNDNTALSAITSIVNTATRNNKPVFCSDIDAIGTGVLAAVGPNQFKLGEKAGDMVLAIISGKKIIDIPVEYANDIEFIIDGTMAKKFNLNISDDMKVYIK